MKAKKLLALLMSLVLLLGALAVPALAAHDRRQRRGRLVRSRI